MVCITPPAFTFPERFTWYPFQNGSTRECRHIVVFPSLPDGILNPGPRRDVCRQWVVPHNLALVSARVSANMWILDHFCWWSSSKLPSQTTHLQFYRSDTASSTSNLSGRRDVLFSHDITQQHFYRSETASSTSYHLDARCSPIHLLFVISPRTVFFVALIVAYVVLLSFSFSIQLLIVSSFANDARTIRLTNNITSIFTFFLIACLTLKYYTSLSNTASLPRLSLLFLTFSQKDRSPGYQKT